MAATYRIYIDLDLSDEPEISRGGRRGFLATVDGTESDAQRLHQFLNGTKAQAVDGTLTDMTWRVTADRIAREAEWAPVEFDERGHVV